jgi:hypothetical protein
VNRASRTERKSAPCAFMFNMVLPGLGVLYALDDRPGLCGLPGWEWALINVAVTIGLAAGGFRLEALLFLNGLIAFAVVAFTVDNTQRPMRLFVEDEEPENSK